MPIHGYPGNIITANPTAPTSSVASGVWTTEQQLIAKAAGNWPLYVPPYQISRSLRFNSADSAYLDRTPASASNRRTFTLSGWVKRTSPGSLLEVFSGYTGLGNGDLRTIARFTAGNLLSISSTQMQVAGDWAVETTQVFRDPSAWYHIVIAVDTTQATSTNRVKMYVNGAEVTAFSYAVYPSLNYQNAINYNFVHYIGLGYDSANPNTFTNGYITEFNFIDGQALTPSSFGETNTSTGVWQAKAYSGSYGTNGFYLNFSDNSNTTAATLGKDYSGNGNNWTPNNFSVTAGVGNDSLVDSPASYSPGDTGVGGQVRGNYCTLNPLSTTAGTYTQGNLRYVGASAFRRSNGTIAVSTGKWYWEVTLGNNPYSPRNSGSVYNAFGFGLSTVFNSTTAPTSTTDAIILQDSGYYKNFSGAVTDAGSAFVSGDVLSIAVDLDANTFTFYKNNTQLVTGTIGGTAGRELVPIIISDSATYGVMDCNFGQRPFAYTAPSGFSCLVTTNLPNPTIGATSTTQADDYFGIATYAGTGGSGTVTTGIDMATGGGLVWFKARNGAFDHHLINNVAGYDKFLSSNKTDVENTYSFVTSATSTGLSINGGSTNVNGSGYNYVAWNWKAGGTGVTNTAGQITSTVSANTTAGFSIVTFTTDNTTKTVGHGLGVKPSLVIVKSRSVAGNWLVITDILGSMQYGVLNSTAAFTSIGYSAPTSTVFQYNDNNGVTQVAYCFAPVAGYSAFGSYTGNGSADGPFVYTGFRPRWLLFKDSSNGTWPWIIVDTARNTYNVMNAYLSPNNSNAEATNFTGNAIIDATANGFKVRTSDAYTNTSTNTYIYAAFAESPFKYALAR